MIVTDELVFVHLHRTGGTFVKDFLFQNDPSAREVGYHYPLSLLPDGFRARPVFGFIRNPWDWYVSWYHFNRSRIRSAFFDVTSEGGALDFERTIANLLELSSEPLTRQASKMLLQLEARLPDSIEGNRGAGITKSDLQHLGKSQIGYYSWLVKRMYALDADETRGPKIVWARFENFAEELVRVIGCLSARLHGVRSWVEAHGRRNASEHGPCARYYSESLRQRISEQDAFVITNFDYDLPSA